MGDYEEIPGDYESIDARDLPYSDREEVMQVPVEGRDGGGYSLNSSYSLGGSSLGEGDNVKQVAIDAEIISYSVKRAGAGIVTKLGSMCGLVSDESQNQLDEIIHGVRCTFKPGELVCLMGPSGAGKTTLLNVLAGRAGGFMVGNVLMNGQVMSQKDIRMMVNYIPQDDILFSALTPREILNYTARLRISGLSKHRREDLVNNLMSKLGITRCADVIVGNELIKGISGGQKKRASVAMELVTNPSILFVDEATSGLDSQTAEDVVKILQEIARTGRTVICTIHQPSFDIFRMFDKLLLLQRGQVVYNGPIVDCVDYFAGLGWACPEYQNPAEYFMKILTLEQPKTLPSGVEVPQAPGESLLTTTSALQVGKYTIHRKAEGNWSRAWQQHQLRLEDQGKTAPIPDGQQSIQQSYESDQFDDLQYPTSFFEQFLVLLERNMWMTFKDRQQFRARLILCICVSLFQGLTYFQFEPTQDTVQNRQSIIFSSILFNGMNMLMNTVVLFPMERAVITREFQNGTYRMLAYYLARVITAISYQFVYVFFYVSILYFMSGMYGSAQAYLSYIMVIALVGMIAVTLGIVIGALVPSVNLGPSLVSPLMMPLIIFSGYLVTGKIPPWFIWIYYISFFQYAFHVLVVTQFKNLVFDCCCTNPVTVPCFCNEYQCPPYCTCDAINPADPPPDVPAPDPESCPVGDGCKTGMDFLELNDFNVGITEQNAFILFGFWAFLVVVGFFALLYRGREKLS
mmetsp:Transcript_29857/g.83425  ORF Transcript_29857/g.83425 Transcript_29857/m.83425 type:complete len:743 (+) Transcript_29857:45-2273(+)|eukprot:CAMPEP_0119145740 /NCGR_PEP_ID=MMETSP1310-20130426/37958_1 /TAXON_ID=464262 /ORGANISM="Genus nov. species nov., Strain RCC2339" /LENGTH=742 /DNA_ID=CAMNT_0007137579 /DNA_START=3 /DNA_END=2231 /DNA_ORIENTATION=+